MGKKKEGPLFFNFALNSPPPLFQAFNCGGYRYNVDDTTGHPDEANPGDYLSDCLSLAVKDGAWVAAGDFVTARAFFALAVLPDVRQTRFTYPKCNRVSQK